MKLTVCFVEIGNIQPPAGSFATKLPAKLATHLKTQCYIPLGHGIPRPTHEQQGRATRVTDLSFNTR
jgi:hypothetical protein